MTLYLYLYLWSVLIRTAIICHSYYSVLHYRLAVLSLVEVKVAQLSDYAYEEGLLDANPKNRVYAPTMFYCFLWNSYFFTLSFVWENP